MNLQEIFIAIAWNGLFLSILLLAIGLQRWTFANVGLRPELQRKWVHLGSGLCMAILPIYSQNQFVAIAVALGSGSMLLAIKNSPRLANRFAFIFERRRGALWFVLAIALLTCALPDFSREFSLAFLILAIADPAAAILGLQFGKRRLLDKTWLGSFSFFCAALGILLVWRLVDAGALTYNYLGISIVVAAILAGVELISTKGTDNLTIPVASMILGSLVLSII